jgi:hypothetical protein
LYFLEGLAMQNVPALIMRVFNFATLLPMGIGPADKDLPSVDGSPDATARLE